MPGHYGRYPYKYSFHLRGPSKDAIGHWSIFPSSGGVIAALAIVARGSGAISAIPGAFGTDPRIRRNPPNRARHPRPVWWPPLSPRSVCSRSDKILCGRFPRLRSSEWCAFWCVWCQISATGARLRRARLWGAFGALGSFRGAFGSFRGAFAALGSFRVRIREGPRQKGCVGQGNLDPKSAKSALRGSFWRGAAPVVRGAPVGSPGAPAGGRTRRGA